MMNHYSAEKIRNVDERKSNEKLFVTRLERAKNINVEFIIKSDMLFFLPRGIIRQVYAMVSFLKLMSRASCSS